MSQDQSAASRGPRDIEAALENNRLRIEHTLELLEDRLRPSVLFDQAWRYANAKSRDGTTSRLQEAVVNNPLPVVLMGAGLAWLLLAGREGSVARADSPLAEATASDAGSQDDADSQEQARSQSESSLHSTKPAVAAATSSAHPSARAGTSSTDSGSASGEQIADNDRQRHPANTRPGTSSSTNEHNSSTTGHSSGRSGSNNTRRRDS